jgi:tetratricopeptide (TPR) repeat protein
MRLTLSVALGATLLFLPQAGSAVDKDLLTIARAKTTKGEKLLRKQQYERAEEAFRTAIEVEAEWPMAHLGLGAALVAQERFEEAIDVLAEAEGRFVAWEQKINMADLKKRQIARRQLESVRNAGAAQHSGSPNAGRRLTPRLDTDRLEGRILTEQFLLRERWALEGFEAIPPQVFYLEGIAYLRIGRLDLGIDALRVCLTIDGKHGLAHYNLAVALFGQGALSESQQHLDAALDAGVEPHAQFVANLEQATAAVQR